ncbi:dihydropteroate synthase [Thermogutta sp.]|uniref:dihydropteroate synthase n=1 Tax=Thermogutta sp. TaxID=1962930 RepID=UPI003220637A
MAIPGLTIIGESINDSVPSTKALFDAGDLDGIVALAKSQVEGGAAYIDVNIGSRSPHLMAEVVRRIQEAIDKPLSIDTPDPQIARAGLEAYIVDRAGGAKPILNSITVSREEMWKLYEIRPFKPILLATEVLLDGHPQPARTAEQTYEAAKYLVNLARKYCPGIGNDDLIIDPGIVPIASDIEGNLKRLLGAMKLIHEDPDLAGVHMSVGLSNFTVMLPSKRKDGSPVKSALESAFLTRAMPLGLDMIIGSVKRKYELLPEDHPAMQCLEAVLQAEGFDAIMAVRKFYAE